MRITIKRTLFFILIFLIVALLIAYAAVRLNASSPLEELEKRWGIKLPQSCEQVYKLYGNLAFDGSGPRYSVFKCDDEKAIKRLLNWQYINLETYDNGNVYRVLHGLETDKKKIDDRYLIPIGEYMCFRQTKGESSIALLYSEEQAILYVLELYL